MLTKIKTILNNIYQSANQRVGVRLDILKSAFQQFSGNRASRAAAGMTYYALFSLFPLLIVMITVGSFFIQGEGVIDWITQVMTTAIPVSNALIERNIQRVVELRNSVGIAGTIGFIWSASNAFTMLTDNINQAFPKTEVRSYIKKRLVAFAILGTIILLLLLSILWRTGLHLLSQVQLPFKGDSSILNSQFWTLASNLSQWVIAFLLFISLYRWVPNVDVPWNSALWSALTVTFMWQVTSMGFSWYLSSGLANYELVYGSLSAIVVLLLWIYLSSLIIFFGAYLCAAINRYAQDVSELQ